MRNKRIIILIAQFFVILTLFLVINPSKFETVAIPLSSVNNKGFNLNTAASWSNATAISDLYGWNDQNSFSPSVAVDGSGNVHVVWHDYTDGEWGIDEEIFYANYTASGWSNATCISDLYGWNDADSFYPSVAVDGGGNVHVVWQDYTDGEWGNDTEIMYANYTASGWSNATVISDDYTGWNNDNSFVPSVAAGDSGNVYVVWEEHTNGEWGNDPEIMYANYNASGWSNATCISDLYAWNNQNSFSPSVAVDGSGNVHVVWHDYTDSAGEWGSDEEIFYANYTASGWSNATVISDLYGWNDGHSYFPSVAVDGSGNVHVVWRDDTDSLGEWGTDWEIMYAKYTASGWSNATCISDLYGWNDAGSWAPRVAVDGSGNLHVVWYDDTNGEWGFDPEIMYAKYTASGWSNATVISDDYTGWNIGNSFYPSVAVDGSGNVHVVWEDGTDSAGEWGSDPEIMYVKISVAKEERFPLELLLLGLIGAPPGLIEQLPFILVGIGIAVLILIIIVVVKKRQ